MLLQPLYDDGRSGILLCVSHLCRGRSVDQSGFECGVGMFASVSISCAIYVSIDLRECMVTNG